jgi:uncharacterized protein (UPF0332 family)
LQPHEKRLQRLSELVAREISLLKEGVSIEAALSRTVDDAMHQAIADRLSLADDFLAMADRLRRARSDLARAAVARYYYAMYHAFRAVAYQAGRGDDHQEHSQLPRWIPDDFPDQANAANALKDARLVRNEADYDPYPTSSAYFKAHARSVAPVAADYVSKARSYVRSKGNPYA